MADSGAIDHVVTKETAKHIPTTSTVASRNGMYFVGANGARIRNFGQKHFTGTNVNKVPLKMSPQVADVRQNLGSIPKLMDQDNDVHFSNRDGSWIKHNPSGTITPMRRRNGDKGVLEFDIFIKKGSEREEKVPYTGKYHELMKLEEDDIDKEELSDSAFSRLVGLI